MVKGRRLCNNLVMARTPASISGTGDGSNFDVAVLHTAATLYYLENATQAQIAARLNTSRASVSRILAEARRQQIVRIEVVALPTSDTTLQLGERVRQALGLDAVEISGAIPTSGIRSDNILGSVLAPAVSRALESVGLEPGDALLVSSGRTLYEVSQFELPRFSGVLVAPTVGGTDQPEGWFQTNEITRRIAERINGHGMSLHAPAMPGARLFTTLQTDPSIQRILRLWPRARCVLAGIGARPSSRTQTPQFIEQASPALQQAVGDMCSRLFSQSGEEVSLPGSDRLIALSLENLRTIPHVIAVAAGPDKVEPSIVAARAGYYSRLVTDPATAQEILDRLENQPSISGARDRPPSVKRKIG